MPVELYSVSITMVLQFWHTGAIISGFKCEISCFHCELGTDLPQILFKILTNDGVFFLIKTKQKKNAHLKEKVYIRITWKYSVHAMQIILIMSPNFSHRTEILEKYCMAHSVRHFFIMCLAFMRLTNLTRLLYSCGILIVYFIINYTGLCLVEVNWFFLRQEDWGECGKVGTYIVLIKRVFLIIWKKSWV